MNVFSPPPNSNSPFKMSITWSSISPATAYWIFGCCCEADVDNCLIWPCADGATCLDNINCFSCLRPVGYAKYFCTIDMNKLPVSIPEGPAVGTKVMLLTISAQCIWWQELWAYLTLTNPPTTVDTHLGLTSALVENYHEVSPPPCRCWSTADVIQEGSLKGRGQPRGG